jgi:hypothetical protein
MTQERRRTFYIVRINCDCGSDIVARTSVKWYLGDHVVQSASGR